MAEKKKFQISPVEGPPAPRKGPRDSQSLEVYLAAKEAQHRAVRIDAEPEELNRFYRSMVQWRKRHREDKPVNVRKDGDAVYVWLDDDGLKR